MPKIKEPRIGHTPMWPDYFKSQYPNRVLAILEGHKIHDEYGGIYIVNSLVDLFNVMFDCNLLVFVESYTNKENFPFLDEVINSEHASVSCTRRGWPIAIRLSGTRNRSRWIVPASTWDRHIDRDFLSDMRDTYNYFSIGPKPTPGSLGQSLMRRSWAENRLQSYSGINTQCQGYLRLHSVGGRCDTFRNGETFPALIELDMSSAYLAHFISGLPIGTSVKFLRDDCWDNCYTFFAHCYVTIHSELPLGPFPMKQNKGRIVYPTLPGTYETYLWKEQVQDAIEAGCDVSINGGYCWDNYTDDGLYFGRDMYRYRIEAPNDIIEHNVKKVTVAALGSFGMHNTYYELIGEDDGESPCLVGDDMHLYDYYVKEMHDYTRPSMYHWFQWYIKETARSLYRIALPYAREGRLIMTNYDAILILEGDESHKYAAKYTLEGKLASMGDLRWQRLTNVTILGDRSLICDQKIVTPGVSHILEEVQI